MGYVYMALAAYVIWVGLERVVPTASGECRVVLKAVRDTVSVLTMAFVTARMVGKEIHVLFELLCHRGDSTLRV